MQTEIIITSSISEQAFSNLEIRNDLNDEQGAGQLNTDATISLSVNAGPDVMLEEFAHLWLLAAEREGLPSFTQAMQQVKQTQAYRDIMNHPVYGPAGRKSADPARYWAHEVLAQAVRTNGQNLTEPQAKNWFEQFIKALWETVKSILNRMGFSIPANTDLRNMKVSELIRIAHSELTSGKNLSNATSKQFEDYLLGKTSSIDFKNSILSGKGGSGNVTLLNFYGQEYIISNKNANNYPPLGFESEQEFINVILKIKNAESEPGDIIAVGIRGSAVRGKSHDKKGGIPFDKKTNGKKSDFDLFVVLNDDAFDILVDDLAHLNKQQKDDILEQGGFRVDESAKYFPNFVEVSKKLSEYYKRDADIRVIGRDAFFKFKKAEMGADITYIYFNQ